MPLLDATADTDDTPDSPDPFEVQRQTSRQLAKPTVEGYTIVAYIGEGTYGDVWKAVHKESGTVDAIKRLHKRPDAQARGEARMLAALSAARGIVRLKKTQLENEPYCYVMEFMQGGTLGELIERSGKLPFAKAWEMFRELVEGLRYVHREGAVHCDIKPDNILLDALGKPRLSDFGQARGHGPGGASLGTPFYMPPEQARLGLPDPRWDVYALGAVLYQMLTGTKPRHNHELSNELSLHSQSSTEVNTRLQKYAAHLDRVPGIGELKDVDPGVVDLLKRCLANDFEARPKDATEVYSLVAKLERKRRQRSLLLFGGVGPAAALLAVGLLMLVGGWFALSAFEKMWIGQVVDDNQAVANAIAEATKDRFNDQLQVVKQEADEHWRQVFIHRPVDRDALVQQVQHELRTTYDAHAPSKRWDRWHVTGADGLMLAIFGMSPGDKEPGFDDEPIKKGNYSWRGWFNGDKDRPETKDTKDSESILAARKASLYLSQPYRRLSDKSWVMTISCKLAAPDGTPQGVVSGQFDCTTFYWFIKSFESSGGHQRRKVVIANEHGQAMYHPGFEEAIQKSKSEDVPEVDSEVSDKQFFTVEPFANPAQPNPVAHADPWYPDQQKYYIGRAAVTMDNTSLGNNQKLAVFVFHDKDRALEGVRSARWMAFTLGVLVLLIGGLFLIANIWGLRRTLSREESAEYA